MTNLLPEENKRLLRREYHVRLVAVACFVTGSVFVFGSVTLLPAYFFAKSQAAAASLALAQVKSSTEFLRGSESVAKLRESRLLLMALKPQGLTTDPTTLIDGVLSIKPAAVTTRSISIQSNGTPEILLNGKAATRESLVAYTTALKQQPFVASVELPVSNLAKDRNLEFSFRVILK